MDTSAERAWDECLRIVRDNVSQQSFRTWFEPLEAKSLTEEDSFSKLTIQVPSRFYYEWLEEHYFSLLRKTITKVLGDEARLFYEVIIGLDDPEVSGQGASMELPGRRVEEQSSSSLPDVSEAPDAPSSDGQQARGPTNTVSGSTDPPADTVDSSASPPKSGSGPRTPDPPTSSNSVADSDPQSSVQNPFAVPGLQEEVVDPQLNDGYTFQRFIEGECNRLARSAARTVAQQPGATSFNPYLAYGGVGLGKTHLIQAVGNYVATNDPGNTVFYVSSERFTSEFVQAIRKNRIGAFSSFYRQLDVLIVDDVQFLSGKEKTQEEFFHIFNALHQAEKQIILSADRPPHEIDGIEERLLSRFQWGLSADLHPPGFETRIEILRRKAEDEGIDLNGDVIECIAHNIESNIRELEGALIRLLAHATLHERDLDLALAKEVLGDFVEQQDRTLTIEEIQQVVCDYMDVREEQIRGKTRKREIVRARQIAMYLSTELTDHSLKTVGLRFGGRDHSTVIHSKDVVADRMEKSETYRTDVEEIKRTIELRSR